MDELDRIVLRKGIQSLSKYLEYRIQLDKESDRGCALVATAILDEKLKELLSALFIRDCKLQNEMLSGVGPLSSFAAKAKLSYLLGIVTKDEYKNIKLVKKIRNIFAHDPDDIHFDDDRIHDICSNLTMNILREDIDDPRRIYTLVVSIMMEIIDYRLEIVKQRVLSNIYSSILEIDNIACDL